MRQPGWGTVMSLGSAIYSNNFFCSIWFYISPFHSIQPLLRFATADYTFKFSKYTFADPRSQTRSLTICILLCVRVFDFARQTKRIKTTNLSEKRASFANKNRMVHIFMTFGNDFRTFEYIFCCTRLLHPPSLSASLLISPIRNEIIWFVCHSLHLLWLNRTLGWRGAKIHRILTQLDRNFLNKRKVIFFVKIPCVITSLDWS